MPNISPFLTEKETSVKAFTTPKLFDRLLIVKISCVTSIKNHLPVEKWGENGLSPHPVFMEITDGTEAYGNRPCCYGRSDQHFPLK